MGIEYKDYYAALGVPKTASTDDIRKAFRTLARKYHPDVARDKKTAEAKFKEINEANEVLSDPAKRKKYDELGANWQSGAEFQAPPGGHRRGSRSSRFATADRQAFEFGGTGFSDFFEQFFARGGSPSGGFDQFATGATEDFAARGHDVEADMLVTLDEIMRGSVRTINLRRRTANDGEQAETYQVRIPAGVREGQKLRLAGRGEKGHGGGPAGDLYLWVRYAQHPDFTVRDGVLHTELELAPWEAAVGATVSVPTLNGPLQMKIPAGTQSGHKLRLRGRGLPEHGGAPGDLHVEVSIRVPQSLTEAERKLWDQLARESKFNPRE